MKKFLPLLFLCFFLFPSSKCFLEYNLKLDFDKKQIDESKIDISFLLKKSDDALYIIGSSNEINSKIAIDTSTAKARGRLSTYVKKDIEKLIFEFLLNANGDPSSEYFSQIVKNISEDISNIALFSSVIDKVYEDRSTDPHTFFVLLKFDLKKIKDNIDDVIKQNVEPYIKLDTTKPMTDLKNYIINLRSVNFNIEEYLIK